MFMNYPDILTHNYSNPLAFDNQEDAKKYSIKQTEFLVGAVCTLLASKFYEIDDKLIMIKEIQKFHAKYY